MGDSAYKDQFANVHSQDTSVLLLKRNLTNRVRAGAHVTFRRLVRCAKTALRRHG